MRRKVLLIIFLFFFLSVIVATSPVYSSQNLLIAVIKSRDIKAYDEALSGFKDGLKKENVKIRTIDYTLDERSNLSKLLAEIKAESPQFILALGTTAAKFAQENSGDIPVISTMVLSPEKNKISPPGVSMDIPYEVELRELKRIFPDGENIGLFYSPDSTFLYEEVSDACRKLDLRLIGKKISSGKELPKALEDISWQIDCFLMLPDSKIYFSKSTEHLLREGLKKGFAIIGLSSAYTKAGALVSFECDYRDLGEQASQLALKILDEEEEVSKTEFITPRKVEFSLNLLVAEKLDIEIPSEIKKEATQVYGK